AAGCAEFDMERRYHHDLVAAADAGKLGMHFGTDVFRFDGVDVLPGRAVALQREFQQTPDDALFGGGEVTAFHTGVVAAVAAEHAVDHQEHQIGVEGEERRSAQRL